MSPKERTPDKAHRGHPPDHSPIGPKPAPAASKRARNNLVALSSMAVLAVYAAGYVRTQSAAQRFEGDAGGRKQRALPEGMVVTPPPSIPDVEPAPAGVLSDLLPVGPETVLLTTTPPAAPVAPPAVATSAAVVAPIPVAESKPVPAEAPATTPAVASKPAQAPAEVSVAATSAPPVSSPVPAPVAATAVAASDATATAAVVTAQNSDHPASALESTPPAPAVGKPAKWKDGKFTGWGSCRHGDIEAIVEIKDGQITSAKVKTCRTGYSCNVIDRVIPQVVVRQSPDIDSVSGSTQSADAFYWAVYSALEEAKIPVPAAKK